MMMRILAIVACLFATPLSAQQQIVCVPDVTAADKAARNAGEELALKLETSNGQWCTAPSMVGKIKRDGVA